jgi:hypothetical protein
MCGIEHLLSEYAQAQCRSAVCSVDLHMLIVDLHRLSVDLHMLSMDLHMLSGICTCSMWICPYLVRTCTC